MPPPPTHFPERSASVSSENNGASIILSWCCNHSKSSGVAHGGELADQFQTDVRRCL